MAIALFFFGLAIGSFLNVLAFRYNPEKFIFTGKTVGGRSFCPDCKATLRWYELIPLLSFLAQWGKCRHCGHSISFRYPLVEFLSGLVFILAPFQIGRVAVFSSHEFLYSTIWIIILETLLLISAIDFRLQIIPDELNIFLAALGIFLIISGFYFSIERISFIGNYNSFIFTDLLPFLGSLLLNRLAGAFLAAAFFAFLILVTKGRGMGVGDLKLSFALGLIFGLPDVVFSVAISFIIGAVWGIFLISFKLKTMKGSVPFGPFLALGFFLTFLLGEKIFGFVFGLPPVF